MAVPLINNKKLQKTPSKTVWNSGGYTLVSFFLIFFDGGAKLHWLNTTNAERLICSILFNTTNRKIRIYIAYMDKKYLDLFFQENIYTDHAAVDFSNGAHHAPIAGWRVAPIGWPAR
jgi:hypothetical protein